MVMQIFHIRLSLGATKNIFINSLVVPALCVCVCVEWGGGGYSDMKKGEWDYITLDYLRDEKKNPHAKFRCICKLC